MGETTADLRLVPVPDPNRPITVNTIRHAVGEDGTMRYRFTLHVALDPFFFAGRTNVALGQMFQEEMMRSLQAGIHDITNDGDPTAPYVAAMRDVEAVRADLAAADLGTNHNTIPGMVRELIWQRDLARAQHGEIAKAYAELRIKQDEAVAR